jgi:hypothetical protein
MGIVFFDGELIGYLCIDCFDDMALYRTIASNLIWSIRSANSISGIGWAGPSGSWKIHFLRNNWKCWLKSIAGVAITAGRGPMAVCLVEISSREAVKRKRPFDTSRPVAGFAHPVEQELADLLSFLRSPAIPWTTNGMEQVIGRMKMRARTVRGYTTWSGMQTGLMLAGMGLD